MKVRIVALSKLKLAPYNPRKQLRRGDKAYRKLRRSMERFGLVQPLVWNKRTGYLIGGHQRLQILKDLGKKTAPVIMVDLPEVHEKALNLVLNNREAQSEWHLPTLTKVLNNLAAESSAVLSASGFDPFQLTILRSQLAPNVESIPAPSPMQWTFEVVLKIPQSFIGTVQPVLDQLLQSMEISAQVRWRWLPEQQRPG